MKYQRTGNVFDVYLSSGLKSETQSKRGQGATRRVTGAGQLPQNWRSFLHDSANKTVLFEYLAEKVVELHTGNRIVITKGPDALTNHPEIRVIGITPCNQEEADTSIFLYISAEIHKTIF